MNTIVGVPLPAQRVKRIRDMAARVAYLEKWHDGSVLHPNSGAGAVLIWWHQHTKPVADLAITVLQLGGASKTLAEENAAGIYHEWSGR